MCVRRMLSHRECMRSAVREVPSVAQEKTKCATEGRSERLGRGKESAEDALRHQRKKGVEMIPIEAFGHQS